VVTEGLHRVVHKLIPPKKEKGILINLGCENWMPAPGFEDCEDFNPDEKNYEIINVDLFPGRPVPNLIIHNLNNLPWPFNDRYADVILSVELIEHLENPWDHFRECRRILKPNGVLILTTPNILAPATMKLWPYFNWFGPEEWEKGEHINPMPIFEFRHIAKKLNFPIVRELYHPPESLINLVLVFKKPQNQDEVENEG